jgi:hypothetical protein
MPWPCTVENVLRGIAITVSDVPTERTAMGSHRQTLLHDLSTFEALLRGEARIDSYHLMTSTCSLLFKKSEKCAPTSIHDALGQGMILDHVENDQVLNSDHVVLFRVLFGSLIVVIPSLRRIISANQLFISVTEGRACLIKFAANSNVKRPVLISKWYKHGWCWLAP